MYLTQTQTLLMIFAVAGGAIVTRVLPFILFPENKKIPTYVTYLGNVLPMAMMGLLVVYCLKSVSILKAPFAIPEAIAIIGIILLHRWKSNVLLSIGGGTLIYVVLIRLM